MTDARTEYASDDEIRPSDFIVDGKMESTKAVIYYGGFISYKYDISPESVVKNLSTLISNKWAQIDPLLVLDKVEFDAAIASLEADLSAENADTSALNSLLGKTNEKFVMTAKSALAKVVFGSVVSPIARLELGTIVRHAQALLDYVAPVVVAQVAPTLAVVVEREVVSV